MHQITTASLSCQESMSLVALHSLIASHRRITQSIHGPKILARQIAVTFTGGGHTANQLQPLHATHKSVCRICPFQHRRFERASMPSLFDSPDATGRAWGLKRGTGAWSQRSSKTEDSSDEPPAEPSETEGPAARRHWWPSPKQTARSSRRASTKSC